MIPVNLLTQHFERNQADKENAELRSAAASFAAAAKAAAAEAKGKAEAEAAEQRRREREREAVRHRKEGRRRIKHCKPRAASRCGLRSCAPPQGIPGEEPL